MIEPLEHKRILEKLKAKSLEGRISWKTVSFEDNRFECDLENYKFTVWKREDRFGALMEESDSPPPAGSIGGFGSSPVILFSVEADEEIIFRSDERRETYELLSDIYEVARRKALNVPEKLAGVAELLDKI